MTKTFKTQEEFDKWMDDISNQYKMSCIIVDKICSSYPFEKDLEIMSLEIEEENTIYDIECEVEYLKDTLESNITIMEEYEDYERCIKIKNILDKL